VKKRHHKKFNASFYKELFMAFLAILSVVFVFYEFFASPDSATKLIIGRFDIFVVLIFLTDFCIALVSAPNKGQYMRSNWYLLLASIPIVDSWAELLRGLRLIELVRLVRAGEHLHYVVNSSSKKRK
jgi:hypothetical protein